VNVETDDSSLKRQPVSLRQQVMSALGWAAAMRLIGQVLTWAMTIVVVRILAPEDYGLMAIAIVFLSLFQGFSLVGIGDAIVQRQTIDDQSLRRIFGLILVVNLTLLVLLCIAAFPIASFYDDDRLVLLVQVASLNFAFRALTTIPEAHLTKVLNFRQISWVDFTASLIGSVAVLILAYHGAKVWSLMCGAIVQSAVRTAGMLLCAPYFKRPTFVLKGLKGIISFSVLRTAENLTWLAYNSADTFIIGRLLGHEALGLYSVAQNLAQLPLEKFGGIVMQVSFPAFAAVQDQEKSATWYLRKVFRLLALCGFPVFFGLSAVAPELVPLVLGPKWLSATVPLQVLAVVAPLRLFSPVTSSFLRGMGQLRIAVTNGILGLILLPVAVAIGCRWGIVGASVAWLCAYPIFFGHMIAHICRVFRIPVMQIVGAISNPALGAAIMYGTISLGRQMLTDGLSSIVTLLILVTLGAITYLTYCLLFSRTAVAELWSLAVRR